MRKVYVIEQWGEDTSLVVESYEKREEAVVRLDELVQAYQGTLEREEDSSESIYYSDPDKDFPPLRLHPQVFPATYDITDAGVGLLVDREPDTVDMETLAHGDKIGRWVDTVISPRFPLPAISRTPIAPDVLSTLSEVFLEEYCWQDGENWLTDIDLTKVFFPTDDNVHPKTIATEEEVLMCYVASIQPHKKFKVYANWGDRADIELTASRGRKVRSEAMARQLFPMLEDYEFVVN